MTHRQPQSQGEQPANLAPELHNDEQDDRREQAQDVAEEALGENGASPLESTKGPGESGLMDDSTQDLVDQMKDMEQSGRIDMGAYRGEPNLDDNEDKYGTANKEDDLPGDGTEDSQL